MKNILKSWKKFFFITYAINLLPLAEKTVTNLQFLRAHWSQVEINLDVQDVFMLIRKRALKGNNNFIFMYSLYRNKHTDTPIVISYLRII